MSSKLVIFTGLDALAACQSAAVHEKPVVARNIEIDESQYSVLNDWSRNGPRGVPGLDHSIPASLERTVAQTSTGVPHVDASNRVADEYSRELYAIFPEAGSRNGFREFNDRAFEFVDDMEKREIDFYRKWESRLTTRLTRESDRRVKTDVRILLDSVKLERESVELRVKLKVLPFYAGTRDIFEMLKFTIIIKPADALTRLRAYVRGAPGQKPLLESYRAHLENRLAAYGTGAVFPMRREIETYLKDSKSFIDGARSILTEAKLSGFEADLVELTRQGAEFDAFVRTTLLPRSRTTSRMPQALYNLELRRYGVDLTPEELIRTSKADYDKLFIQFREVASKIAEKNNLPDASPAAVIQFLKRKQIAKPAEVKALYDNANLKLEKILRDRDMVTLPAAPPLVRLASDAESKVIPIPHLQPPPFIDNKGEMPTFVLPTSSDGKPLSDDFSYVAGATTLTAHEARPGHELQYSRMVEQKVSVIRATYAFNSANVEGWGMYAERIMFPFYELEEQLPGIQMILLRMARAFLDPELQLGKIGPERVIELQTKELGYSKTFSETEVRRYTFQMPGQATSYYFGMNSMLNTRKKLEAKLGARFTEKCFHDAVLSFGLMPLKMVESELMSTLQCGSRR